MARHDQVGGVVGRAEVQRNVEHAGNRVKDHVAGLGDGSASSELDSASKRSSRRCYVQQCFADGNGRRHRHVVCKHIMIQYMVGCKYHQELFTMYLKPS